MTANNPHLPTAPCMQCGRDTGSLALAKCPDCGWDLSVLAKTDCVRCGYDAGVATLDRCPECGWKLSVRHVDGMTFRRARRYFALSVGGMIVSGFGTCLSMPAYFSGWNRNELIAIAGLMIFAGIGMVRSCRLFRCMRRFESRDEARWYAGAAAVVFGGQLAFLLAMVL